MAKDFFKVYDHWSLFTIFRIKIRTDAYTHLFSNSKSFANMYIYMIFIILIMYMGDVMQRPEEGINILDVELKALVHYSVCVLGTELMSSAEAMPIL